jgi:undecaprenyl diphosphate synthase
MTWGGSTVTDATKTGTPSGAVVTSIPRHVAIIMDGNGRWARQKGWTRLKGHEAGAESVRVVLRCCREWGIHYLTLYAFSVENWVRPKPEIEGLMRLLVHFLRSRESELHEHRVRLRAIGRLTDLPLSVQTELKRVEAATAAYTDGELILALSYGGRTEIAQATREIGRKVKAGEIDPETIDERTVAAHLYAPDIPDPDLMIRTSGEMRLSNFLLWQLSYTELYVADVMWPDFREAEFSKAIEAYGARQRRFGDTEVKH